MPLLSQHSTVGFAFVLSVSNVTFSLLCPKWVLLHHTSRCHQQALPQPPHILPQGAPPSSPHSNPPMELCLLWWTDQLMWLLLAAALHAGWVSKLCISLKEALSFHLIFELFSYLLLTTQPFPSDAVELKFVAQSHVLTHYHCIIFIIFLDITRQL